MGNPIFIRTAEGVLLRFEEASIARRWIESGRIQWTDRFLGTDQAWHPLTDLLDFSQAGRATAVTPPAFPAGGIPPREAPGSQSGAVGSEDPRRTAEWVPPVPEASTPPSVSVSSGPGRGSDLRSADPAGAVRVPGPVPSGEAMVVQETRSMALDSAPPGEGPTRSEEEANPPAAAPEGEWWASDPGGARSVPIRRVILLVAMVVAVVVGVLAMWWTHRVGIGGRAGLAVLRDVAPPGGIGNSAAAEPGPERGPDAGGEDAGIGEDDPGQQNGGPGAAPDDPGLQDTGAGSLTVLSPNPQDAGPVSRGNPERDPGMPPGPAQEPDTYDAHLEAGNRLMSSRPDAAMAHFRRAAQLRPARVEPVSRLGDLAMQQQDLAGAERYYREAMRRNADYGPTMLGMARLKQRLGQREDARYWYTRYLERFPQGSGAAEARAYLESP